MVVLNVMKVPIFQLLAAVYFYSKELVKTRLFGNHSSLLLQDFQHFLHNPLGIQLTSIREQDLSEMKIKNTQKTSVSVRIP